MKEIILTPKPKNESLNKFCTECRNIEQKIENIGQDIIIATDKLYKIQTLISQM